MPAIHRSKVVDCRNASQEEKQKQSPKIEIQNQQEENRLAQDHQKASKPKEIAEEKAGGVKERGEAPDSSQTSVSKRSSRTAAGDSKSKTDRRRNTSKPAIGFPGLVAGRGSGFRER